ncbi:hypothetical protein ACFFU8_18205 [Chromobacterium piscinae]|uniref:hypothetical protein n=1 Tax=Chromobacterium piscinae TaxID=686831 RepID=UPI001E3DBCDA|nr:hypothetical protein [Chromobacterium piscinae]MCD5326750.1 hypothetical protein [Chromobacterium piscinae]
MKQAILMPIMIVLSACGTSQNSRAVFYSLEPSKFSTLSLEATKKHTEYANLLAASGANVNTPALMTAAELDKSATQKLTDEENKDINEKLSKVLMGCNSVISGMQQKVEDQERYSFWLSMSGLFAGAVIAPAATAANATAHRALISATSGWAGATNLAAQTLRTAGLAGDAVAATRNNIVVAMNTSLATATNSSNSYLVRFAALEQVQAACIAYSVTVPGAAPMIAASSAK